MIINWKTQKYPSWKGAGDWIGHIQVRFVSGVTTFSLPYIKRPHTEDVVQSKTTLGAVQQRTAEDVVRFKTAESV